MSARANNTEMDPASIMRESNKLLAAGRTVDAEELVLRWAQDVRRRAGAGSHADAVAHHQLGSLLMNVGQLDRAVEAFREALAGPVPEEQQALRDRLTFLTSLGQALALSGRLEEAEVVLIKGLEGRASFYGAEHPGYAFGLEPLAELTMRMGKADAAIEMMEQVVGIFRQNGHDRLIGAIALRAEMLKSAGKSTPPFKGLEKFPNDAIEQIGKLVIVRAAKNKDRIVGRRMLADLLPLLESRLGPSHPAVVGALIAISNIEMKLDKAGDHELRQTAIKRLIAIYDAQGQTREALQATMGLALAQSDAGETSQAIETNIAAVARARGLQDPAEISQSLRNSGLLLAQLKRDVEAEPQLRESIAQAERSGDRRMLGRSLIAAGIFLQHAGRTGEARPLLRRAIPLLDPADLDAITAKTHLRAIETGGPCGCGDESAGIADAFREFVTTRLPAGLLQRLDVALEDGEFAIGVHLDREASDDELQHVNRVVQHALDEFRRKISRSGGGSAPA